MAWGDLILTVLPILAVVFLLAYKEWPADTSGLVGWLLTVAVAIGFFGASFDIYNGCGGSNDVHMGLNISSSKISGR